MPEPIRSLKLAEADIGVFDDPTEACGYAAAFLSFKIQQSVAKSGKFALGLATGATPEPVYARLIQHHKAGSLSFENVTTFNLDEYYPMSPLDLNSYRYYMERHLFSHVDIAPNRAHVLDGTVPEAFAAEHALQFDRWIAAEGGLDFQLLGLGRNGHIGFNEPTGLSVEQAVALPTRVVELHPFTIADAAKDFGGEENVPRRALTMGVASILAARSILVLAFGERKAQAVARSLKGPITAEVPGSLLQTVPGKVTWMIDKAAASEILYVLWEGRMFTVYTFGDSILDCGSYNGEAVEPGRLLVKNDDRLFPEFQGRDLSSRGPARLDHRAIDGSIVDDLPEQADGLIVEAPSIALLTIGGNDLLIGLLDDTGPKIEAFARGLEHFLEGLPIRPVLIGSVYDPTFGNDDLNVFGVDPNLGRENFRRVNEVLANLGKTYGAFVDLHAHFLKGEPSWFTRTIEPSLVGASEVRRCFLDAIEAGNHAC